MFKRLLYSPRPHVDLLMVVALSVVLSCISCQTQPPDDVGIRRPDEVNDYFDSVRPLLDPATESLDTWSDLVSSQQRTAYSQRTPSDQRAMLEETLDVLTIALQLHRKAAEGLPSVIPPRECAASHTATLESLHLTEAGLTRYLNVFQTVGTGGGVDQDLLEKADRFMIDANLSKQKALSALPDSDCQ